MHTAPYSRKRALFFRVLYGRIFFEEVAERYRHAFEYRRQVQAFHECHGLALYLLGFIC
jgi:hypothetical protein